MPAIVRRHRWRILLVGVGLVMMMAFWLPGLLLLPGLTHALETDSEDREVLPPLAPHRYAQIQEIRQDLALTNLDIVALDCDPVAAESILRTIREWVEANSTQLDQIESERRTIYVQLQEALIEEGAGSKDVQLDSSIAHLKQQLDANLNYKRQQLMLLANQIEAHLTSSQVTAWSAESRSFFSSTNNNLRDSLIEADRRSTVWINPGPDLAARSTQIGSIEKALLQTNKPIESSIRHVVADSPT